MSVDVLDTLTEVRLGHVRLPLFGSGNIWIEDSIADRASIGLVQGIIQQAWEGTSPGQLELMVFDDALSGLSAPFEGVNAGGERLMQTLYDAAEFKDALKFLRSHVQAVNNVMQGLAPNLVDFRTLVDYPVEGFKLVVISTDISLLEEDVQNQLGILLKAGPPTGVSFLIHSTTLEVNPYLVDMCSRLLIRSGQVVQDTDVIQRSWWPPEAASLIKTAEEVATRLAGSAMSLVDFGAVQPLDQRWTSSSLDGVSFSIGRYGLDAVEITLGDELNQRHNVLITGAVGQGKSNLISVIIHSLCQRYSPEELELYLLDFKEGVTLQPFSSPATGEYLLHARVLGLEADREFGLSVFHHLFALYRERMRQFKGVGVQNLKQYRQKFPQAVMPRLVVIIDEYQMMFAERDRVSDEIADLLVKGVRLFRACGIHVILASQTIGGNMSLMGAAGEGLFGQVPVRIALKNSLSESHATLGPRNDAAAHLRARQAIVNVDYGNPSSNRKTSIAHADEDLLDRLRHLWWLDRPADSRPPYLFEGDRRRELSDDCGRMDELAASTDGVPHAMLGSRVEVSGRPMEVPLSREIGRNVAVVGAGDGFTVLGSAAVSLVHQAPRARFLVLDGAGWGERRFSGLLQALRSPGAGVVYVPKIEIDGKIGRLVEANASLGDGITPTFVLGFSLDQCRSMPPEFQSLCREGPPRGIHLIAWWTKLELFREQVGYGGEAYFDTKVALRLDAASAKQFFGDPLLEWVSRDNRAVVGDNVLLDRPVSIIPYTIDGYCVADLPREKGA